MNRLHPCHGLAIKNTEHPTRNQRGASLVELLVVVAMMGIVTMGVTDLSLWVIKSNNSSKFQQERVMQHEEIRQHLSVAANCQATFGPLGNLNGPQTFNNFDFRNGDGSVAFVRNTPRGVGQVRIDSTELQTFTNSSTESAELRIGYSSSLTVVGPNQTSAQQGLMLIRLERDPAGNLLRCLSQAMMSDGIWRHVSSAPADIFFAGGNVGIGTSQPGSILELSSNLSWRLDGLRIRDTATTPNGWATIRMDAAAGNATKSVGIHFGGDASGNNQLRFARLGDNFGTWEANPVNFDMDAPGDSLLVDGSGNVGIRTGSPTHAVQVGVAGANLGGLASYWTTFSDARLKQVEGPIQNANAIVKSLTGHYYRWKSGQDRSRQVGVLAQEVEQVLPEVVRTGADGIKTVDYSKLTAVLIESNKEMLHRIETLERRLKAQEQRMRVPATEKH